MPVELDVTNSGGKLTPGMYAEVQWPISRGDESLFVPSAIKATTERIFVIRVRNGVAEWVNVRRGMSEDGLVEVFADLEAGDPIVQRATDEIRPGTRVTPRQQSPTATSRQLSKASSVSSLTCSCLSSTCLSSRTSLTMKMSTSRWTSTLAQVGRERPEAQPVGVWADQRPKTGGRSRPNCARRETRSGLAALSI